LLLLPSAERALAMDKAYAVIVKEQSYIYGRDAHVAPVETVHREVDSTITTGVEEPIRLERYPLR